MKLSTVEAFKHIQSKDAITLSDAQLRSLQKVLTGMLEDLDTVCRRHGLVYMLGGGSALGAVRHHGFIPWDDDIDVNMPRKDHDIFVKVFEEEMGQRYWVHTPSNTENYGLCLSRILLKGTSVKTREDFHNDECGAFIDIFVIENTYNDPIRRNIHGFGSLFLGFLQSCRKFARDRQDLMRLIEGEQDENRRKQYRKVFRTKILIGRMVSFLSMDSWTHLTDRWYRLCGNDDTKYVTVPSGRGHFYGEMYERSGYSRPIDIVFEDMTSHVACDYDGYLRRLYGDYMTIPKTHDQEKHVFFKPFYLDSSKETD